MSKAAHSAGNRGEKASVSEEKKRGPTQCKGKICDQDNRHGNKRVRSLLVALSV